MSADHHSYQTGPTLPPLRPSSFPSSHPVARQYPKKSLSHSSKRPAQSASPIPQSNQTSSPTSVHTFNRANHHNSYNPYQHPTVYPSRDEHQDKHSNSEMVQPSVNQRNNCSPILSDPGNVNTKRGSHAHLIIPEVSNSNSRDHKLKRKASRAELDHPQACGGDKLFQSKVAPCLPASHSKSRHEHPKSHSQCSRE
ncbi:hypothetical protein PTTG_28589 [Puccinia triticina 1-1 BBBD Race 1]|uniref:Uncharacterized protein n=1 Tax=Puccinia triticina (isolate 1-1 / race 1 (BBBD)) TaxID=630390 RepID=A0A180GAH0_PUCT1|nr:hypothetical protein PTTG_28589 [Puccinia triticina 1-1 BBBD Race 1]